MTGSKPASEKPLARRPGHGALFRFGLLFGSAALIAFLTLPLLGLLSSVRPLALLEHLMQRPILEALKLSVITSVIATLLVVAFGLPTAYWLATRDFSGKRFAETLVYLPMVMPPTVAGLALLLAFGRNGLAGAALEFFGIRLPFSTLGVVVAQAFMSAPFFVAPSRAAFVSLEERYAKTAATLRASEGYTFWRITLPMCFPSLLAAAAMCWARALGEFGATITFAGNMAGKTQTMPLAVYIAIQSDLDAALALSVLLVASSLAILFALQFTSVGLFSTRRAAR